MNELKAYCLSANCTGSHHKTKPVEKTVKGRPIDCPDCGSVLKWARSRGSMRTYSSNRFSKRSYTEVIL